MKYLKTYRYIILSITAIFISVLHGCSPAAYSIFSGPAESGEKNVTLVVAGHNQPNTVVGIKQIDKEQFSDTVHKNKTKSLMSN